MDVKTVAVIGAGTMGNGIAHTFAQFGFNVILIDLQQPLLEKALRTIGANLDRQIKKGQLTEQQKIGDPCSNPYSRRNCPAPQVPIL